jgi:hypothetical protein
MFNLLATSVKTERGASSADWGFHKTTEYSVPKKTNSRKCKTLLQTRAFFVHSA